MILRPHFCSDESTILLRSTPPKPHSARIVYALLILVLMGISKGVYAQWEWTVIPPYAPPIKGNSSSLAEAEAQMRSACKECQSLKKEQPGSGSYRYKADPYFDPIWEDWIYTHYREGITDFSGRSLSEVNEYLKSQFPSSEGCPETQAQSSGSWISVFNPPYRPSLGDEYCSGDISYPGYPSNGTLVCEGGVTITKFYGQSCSPSERVYQPYRRRNTICEFTGYTTRPGTHTIVNHDGYSEATCSNGMYGYVKPPSTDTTCDSSKTQNPCVIATGEKLKSAQDFTSSTLNFRRYYNSQSTANELSIGIGWRHSFSDEMYIYRSPAPRAPYPLNLVWTNGNLITLGARAGGNDYTPTYQESNTSDVQKVVSVDDEWHVHRENGDLRIYNSAGKLIRTRTRQGQVTLLSYDDDSRLVSIKDTYGKTIELQYNGRVISKAILPDASEVIYEYDARSNLVSVTHPDSTPGSSASQPLIYHYEDDRFPHHLTGITDENGDRTQTYTYDETGRVISSEKAKTESDVGQERVELEYQ